MSPRSFREIISTSIQRRHACDRNIPVLCTPRSVPTPMLPLHRRRQFLPGHVAQDTSPRTHPPKLEIMQKVAADFP